MERTCVLFAARVQVDIVGGGSNIVEQARDKSSREVRIISDVEKL